MSSWNPLAAETRPAGQACLELKEKTVNAYRELRLKDMPILEYLFYVGNLHHQFQLYRKSRVQGSMAGDENEDEM